MGFAIQPDPASRLVAPVFGFTEFSYLGMDQKNGLLRTNFLYFLAEISDIAIASKSFDFFPDLIFRRKK